MRVFVVLVLEARPLLFFMGAKLCLSQFETRDHPTPVHSKPRHRDCSPQSTESLSCHRTTPPHPTHQRSTAYQCQRARTLHQHRSALCITRNMNVIIPPHPTPPHENMIYVVKNAQKHAVPMGKPHKKARVYRSTEPRTKMKKNLEIPGPKVPKTLHTSTSASSATSASVPRRSSTPSSPTNGNEPQILDTTTRHDFGVIRHDTRYTRYRLHPAARDAPRDGSDEDF